MSRERDRWLAALLAVVLIMTATYLFSDVIFQTNDDNGIVVAASGGVTGEPYAGNGLTSYIYGALLSGLYSVCPDVPWHAGLMTAVQILALIAILRSLFALCSRKGLSPLWGLIAFVALYIGVGMKFMVRLQFSAVAGYCAAALAALLWTLPEGKRARCFACGLGLVLIAYALLVRFQSGLLALPVPLMMGVVLLLKRDREQKCILWTLVGMIALAGFSYGSDLILYPLNEPGWQEHTVFGELSGVLLDYHNNDEAYALATEVTDWSPELIRCIRNWNLFIDVRFNTENLAALAQAIEDNAQLPTVFEVAKKTGSVVKRYPEFAWNALGFTILGAWALVSYLRRREGWNALLLLGLAGSTLAVIAYFYGYKDRFPDRIAFAYALPVYVAALMLILDALPTQGNRRLAAAGAALMLLTGGATLCLNLADTLVLPSDSAGRLSRAALTEQANAYAAQHPDTLYVTDVGQSFYAFSTQRPPVNLLEWGNAMVRSPMYRVKLSKLGYAEGFTSRDLADENVRLLFADGHHLQRLMDCLNADIAPWQAVLEENAGLFNIYRLE